MFGHYLPDILLARMRKHLQVGRPARALQALVIEQRRTIFARRGKHCEKELHPPRRPASASKRRPKEIQCGIYLDVVICSEARIRRIDDPILPAAAITHRYVIV